MIVLDLRCAHGHRFEGWFASTEAFADQSARGLVACPSCGDTRVERQLSAPYVQTRSHSTPSMPDTQATPSPEDIARLLTRLRQLGRSAEDVGDRFPEEARRIHRGEAEERGIRGRASGDDLRELLEEGITVLPVLPDPEDLH